MKNILFFLAFTAILFSCSKSGTTPSGNGGNNGGNNNPPPDDTLVTLVVLDSNFSIKTNTIDTIVSYKLDITPEGLVTGMGVYFLNEAATGVISDTVKITNLTATFKGENNYTKTVALPGWPVGTPLVPVLETMKGSLTITITGEVASAVTSRLELQLYVKLPNQSAGTIVPITARPKLIVSN